jgi:serine/threonine protein kinase
VSATAYDIPKGTVLGKYEVLRKLATGGMAEIYVARVRGTAGFEKLVVLKRILPNVAQDPTFVRMFLDEARLAATLQHPNIADVYDVGEVDGTYFFTMELIHGEDARAIRAATKKRGERAPLAIALAIIQGTAAALDYAHEKQGPQGPLGLVHRDVSASNILVSYDGAVKLVDFGIARATSSETKTRTGTLKGKIPYMSPEQCRGHQLDRRSDLFSLGTVAYELTVGRRPFRGETDFQMMEQIVHHDARPPTQIDPEYPKELEAIVLKLLARDVRARYQSADHLLHDLDELTQAQRLWASSNVIGKYMRSLFADKVDAWEAAERDGMTLGQHVMLTATNQSHQSGTPSSALQPLSSEAIAPVLPRSSSMPIAVRPDRRGMVIGGAALLTLAGVAGGYYAMREQRAPAPPAANVAPAPVVEVTPPPKVEAPAVSPTVETPTAEPIDKPIEKTVKRPPQVVKKQARPAATKKPPPAKPAAKPADKPAEKPAEKERPWDPNSPFLPPPN